jgi:hypothetical protein
MPPFPPSSSLAFGRSPYRPENMVEGGDQEQMQVSIIQEESGDVGIALA